MPKRLHCHYFPFISILNLTSLNNINDSRKGLSHSQIKVKEGTQRNHSLTNLSKFTLTKDTLLMTKATLIISLKMTTTPKSFPKLHYMPLRTLYPIIVTSSSVKLKTFFKSPKRDSAPTDPLTIFPEQLNQYS